MFPGVATKVLSKRVADRAVGRCRGWSSSRLLASEQSQQEASLAVLWLTLTGVPVGQAIRVAEPWTTQTRLGAVGLLLLLGTAIWVLIRVRGHR